MAKKNNVVEIRATRRTTEEGLQETYSEAMACLRAVDALRTKLVDQAKMAKAKWKEQLSEATHAYRAPIREEFERVSAGVDLDSKAGKALRALYSEKFLAVVRGVKEHDEIEAKAKADKDARNEKIDRVQLTVRECIGVNVTAQTDLFATSTPGTLPWATAQGRQVIFTAMQTMDADGATLCPIQTSVFSALAAEGVEAMDLGAQASSAVEADDYDDDDEQDDGDDESDELDVGF